MDLLISLHSIFQHKESLRQEEEEEGHEEGEEGHDEGVGLTGLLQDPHPHVELGLATSFAHL
jgi:hypothetical protein